MIGNGHAGFGRAASEKDPQGHLADVVPRPARARRSAHPQRRQDGQTANRRDLLAAQRRLHRTWRRLDERGKRRTIVAVAVARELAGFCWALAQSE